MIIIHFALKSEWDNESVAGNYGKSCIEKGGFIPCYTVNNISNLNLSLSTLKEYIILCIDESKIKSNIKYEQNEITGNEEPNIYGEISKDAVINILPYTFNNEDKFIPSNEILDLITLNDVTSKINTTIESIKYFHDGTTSRIILLNNEYIVKIADENQLKAAVKFSTLYENVPSLQKLAYYDENYKYVVYNFIPGDVMHTIIDFDDLAKSIKNIVNNYKNYTGDEFGYIDEPSESWSEFLRKEVKNASTLFADAESFLPEVEDAIEELNKYPFDKKLIHGDFGAHNFIKRNEKFVAAIDPMPIAGDPTYDLLFALVSNIDLLPFLSKDYLATYTKEPKPKINALLKVVLFCRICRCIKYNKEDLENYLDFWYNLFN